MRKKEPPKEGGPRASPTTVSGSTKKPGLPKPPLELLGKTQVDIGRQPASKVVIELEEKPKFNIGDRIELEGKTNEWYTITKMAGKGGVGAVYVAVHVKIDREGALSDDTADMFNEKIVAIKTLELPPGTERRAKEMKEQFMAEMRVLRTFNHPNIVSVLDYGRDQEGRLCYVMEYLEGEDIYQEIHKNGGRLSWEQTQPIAVQLCSALKAAHDKKVVHFDVKPNNILLVPVGNINLVKVFDFGLLRHEKSDMEKARKKREEGIIDGTPDYVSPEQLQLKEADHRADIYATGVVIYRMLTGTVPFLCTSYTGDEFLTFRNRVISEPPDMEPLLEDPNIPPEVIDAVQKCLAKNPKDRFQDIGELQKILENAGNGKPLIKPAIPRAPDENTPIPTEPAYDEASVVRLPPKKKMTVRAKIAAAIAAILIAGVGVGTVFRNNIYGDDGANIPAPMGRTDPVKPSPAVVPTKPSPTKMPNLDIRPPEPIQTEADASPAPEPPQKAQYRITIKTNVGGARVYVEGENLGKTRPDGSFTFERQESDERERISVKLGGHKTASTWFIPNEDQEKRLRLREDRGRSKSPTKSKQQSIFALPD